MFPISEFWQVRRAIQNSVLNSMVKPLLIAKHDHKMLIYGKWHHLTLHIIPNRKLHTISFQMAYNAAVCPVGTLNSSNNAFLEFGRSNVSSEARLYQVIPDHGNRQKRRTLFNRYLF